MNFAFLRYLVCMTLVMSLSLSGYAQIFLPHPILYKRTSDQLLIRWEPASIKEWHSAMEKGYKVEIYDASNSTLMQGHRTIHPARSDSFGEMTKSAPDKLRDLYSTCHALNYPEEQKGHDIIELMSAMEKPNAETEDSFRISFLSFYSCMDMGLAEANAMGATFNIMSNSDFKIVLTVEGHEPRMIYTDHKAELEGALPLPRLSAVWKDQYVELKWDVKDRYVKYFGYQIEESLDGVQFQAVSGLPVLDPSVGMDGAKGLDSLSFSDSLRVNYKTTYYRLKPVDYFGQISDKYSQISGYGYKLIRTSPMITLAEQMDNNSAHITWKMDDREKSLLRSFSVLRSEIIEGPYEVVKDSLDSSTREVFIPMEHTQNYYRIEAIPKDGNPLSSMPVFIIGIDSTPPLTPVVIEGIIDSNGMVRITWHPNAEQDLWGYRVFKANYGSEEHALLNAKPLRDTIYYDSISQKLATERIYYLLQAIDKRNNKSPFSEPIIITKPDKTPPGFAVITKLEQKGDSVMIDWIPSVSKDVEFHELLRRNVDTKDDWIRIAKILPEMVLDSVFIDSDVSLNQTFEYTIKAIDEVGLISEMAQVKSIKLKPSDTAYSPFKEITTTISPDEKEITIKWEVNNPDDYRSVLLYRGNDEARIGKYQYIDSPAMSFTESMPSEGVVFYRLKPVFDGDQRPFISEILRIEAGNE